MVLPRGVIGDRVVAERLPEHEVIAPGKPGQRIVVSGREDDVLASGAGECSAPGTGLLEHEMQFIAETVIVRDRHCYDVVQLHPIVVASRSVDNAAARKLRI